jgi:hypothetical protein
MLACERVRIRNKTKKMLSRVLPSISLDQYITVMSVLYLQQKANHTVCSHTPHKILLSNFESGTEATVTTKSTNRCRQAHSNNSSALHSHLPTGPNAFTKKSYNGILESGYFFVTTLRGTLSATTSIRPAVGSVARILPRCECK